ncbi:hypothetical protein E6P09_17360 (plasmid) [Haloferax mediterranei ATCC 33500]|uniref:DUF1102 domain-containing protein n=3 Tax=Haloferacaceae TaxID=1644056 RepID=I3RAF6_HALMT|nr:hypothetical protein HFX_6090 [Haloferax mediterranei ATCC 33500]ELZ97451.1 hypothetical protein C439_19053 [Haloferax mediterranei ATCC 33500]QCQ77070.1 hypothetical protein E6P09_17360 [Haloferax mediterranei ATCC 33500]
MSMKMNRRSVLGLIGTIGIGTGAAFGSGAFSTVEATREVEVNVVGVDDNGDDDGSEIADQFTDVLVDASADEVALRDSNDDLVTDPTTLFPTSNDTLDANGTADIDENYVSLIANDVTVVFGYKQGGTDERLLPNSTYTYPSGFFTLVNNGDGNGNGKKFSVELESGNTFLTEIGGQNPHSEEVAADTTSEFGATLETGQSGTESETLTIRISEV